MRWHGRDWTGQDGAGWQEKARRDRTGWDRTGSGTVGWGEAAHRGKTGNMVQKYDDRCKKGNWMVEGKVRCGDKKGGNERWVDLGILAVIFLNILINGVIFTVENSALLQLQRWGIIAKREECRINTLRIKKASDCPYFVNKSLEKTNTNNVCCLTILSDFPTLSVSCIKPPIFSNWRHRPAGAGHSLAFSLNTCIWHKCGEVTRIWKKSEESSIIHWLFHMVGLYSNYMSSTWVWLLRPKTALMTVN